MADPPATALSGAAARALAARLAERGYRVRFPPGRDPAVFRVTGLPGGPPWRSPSKTTARPPDTTPAAARRKRPRSSPGYRQPPTPRTTTWPTTR